MTNIKNKKGISSLFSVLFIIILFSFRGPNIGANLLVNVGFLRVSRILDSMFDPKFLLIESTSFASQLFQQSISLNNQEFSAWRGMGLIEAINGKKKESISTWMRAGLSPSEEYAILGKYAQAIEQYDQALEWYGISVNLDQNQAEIWYQMGELYRNQKQELAAIDAYQKAWNLGDLESVDPLTNLLTSKSNDYSSATMIWQQALENYPEYPLRVSWWRGLATTLRITQQWQESLLTTHVALNEIQDDPRLYVEYALALYFAENQLNQAEMMIEQALALDENFAFAYAAMGRILISEMKYDDAIEWYTHAINRNNENASWYIARANAAYSANEIPLAIDFYHQALVRFPNNADIYYKLSFAYQKNNNQEMAINTIEAAIENSRLPNQQYFIRAGQIYEWSDFEEKALASYEQALKIDTESIHALQGINRIKNNFDE